MAFYRTIEVDLTTAGDRQRLVNRETKVVSVFVAKFTLGTDLKIHIGDTKDAIPITLEGMAFEPCPPENEGIALTFGAQPGTKVTFVISFEGGEVGIAS